MQPGYVACLRAQPWAKITSLYTHQHTQLLVEGFPGNHMTLARCLSVPEIDLEKADFWELAVKCIPSARRHANP